MTSPTIFTTPTQTYADPRAYAKEVVMTLLKRVEDDAQVKIGVQLGPPLNWEMYLSWDDVAHSITHVLAAWRARLMIGKMPLAGNLRWRDDFDCGLVGYEPRPPS